VTHALISAKMLYEGVEFAEPESDGPQNNSWKMQDLEMTDHLPALRFGPSPSRSCIFPVLCFRSQVSAAYNLCLILVRLIGWIG